MAIKVLSCYNSLRPFVLWRGHPSLLSLFQAPTFVSSYSLEQTFFIADGRLGNPPLLFVRLPSERPWSNTCTALLLVNRSNCEMNGRVKIGKSEYFNRTPFRGSSGASVPLNGSRVSYASAKPYFHLPARRNTSKHHD